jgi:hypothetical protein
LEALDSPSGRRVAPCRLVARCARRRNGFQFLPCSISSADFQKVFNSRSHISLGALSAAFRIRLRPSPLPFQKSVTMAKTGHCCLPLLRPAHSCIWAFGISVPAGSWIVKARTLSFCYEYGTRNDNLTAAFIAVPEGRGPDFSLSPACDIWLLSYLWSPKK